MQSVKVVQSSRRGPWVALGLLGLLALLTGAVAFYLIPTQTLASSPEETGGKGEWVAAKRADFEVLCREEGELKPVKVTALSFMRWGKVSFLVPDGTFVKKGEKLVALETIDLEEEVQRMQEDLSLGEKNLAQQEQLRDLEYKRLDTDLETEKERYIVAKLRESELLAKPLPLDKEEAVNELAGARARLENAKADYQALLPLAEKGFASGNDIEARRLAVSKANVELDRAMIKYKKAMDGAMPEERKQAALTRESAELALKVKELDAVDKKDDLKAKVDAAERLVRLLQQKYERRHQDLARSALVAPHDGIAIHRSLDFRGNNSKKVQIGDNVHPWAVPVELPSFDRMKVRTQVPESFIRKLKARQVAALETNADLNLPPKILERGSAARVTVTTQQDRVYPAEITWIDGWARDRNSKLSDADIKAQGLSGVRIFDVEVELLEVDTQRLREGFRATIEFPVEIIKNVIAIPVNAVTMRDGATHVRVQDASGVESWRRVELGVQSLDRVVVTSGLNEGERVFALRPPPKPVEQKKKAGEEDEKASAPARARDGGSAPGAPKSGAGEGDWRTRNQGGAQPGKDGKESGKDSGSGDGAPPKRRRSSGGGGAPPGHGGPGGGGFGGGGFGGPR